MEYSFPGFVLPSSAYTMVPSTALIPNSHYGISFLKNYLSPPDVPLLSVQCPVHPGCNVMFQLHLPLTLTFQYPPPNPGQMKPLRGLLTCPDPLLAQGGS